KQGAPPTVLAGSFCSPGREPMVGFEPTACCLRNGRHPIHSRPVGAIPFSCGLPIVPSCPLYVATCRLGCYTACYIRRTHLGSPGAGPISPDSFAGLRFSGFRLTVGAQPSPTGRWLSIRLVAVLAAVAGVKGVGGDKRLKLRQENPEE